MRLLFLDSGTVIAFGFDYIKFKIRLGYTCETLWRPAGGAGSGFFGMTFAKKFAEGEDNPASFADRAKSRYKSAVRLGDTVNPC